ncbi:MAG: hypothetical protein ABI680_17415, partial [Chthoniobacteraceae bacterium]
MALSDSVEWIQFHTLSLFVLPTCGMTEGSFRKPTSKLNPFYRPRVSLNLPLSLERRPSPNWQEYRYDAFFPFRFAWGAAGMAPPAELSPKSAQRHGSANEVMGARCTLRSRASQS